MSVNTCITCGKRISASRIRNGRDKCWGCNTNNHERICSVCGAEFVGVRNTCVPCRGSELSQRYSHVKSKSKSNGYQFLLTKEQYIELTKLPCYYCDGQLGKVKSCVGLDRLDNSRGYEIDNVVSCCTICNRTRGDTWSPEETRHMIQAALQFRKTNANTATTNNT